jgi:hypothetical protein
MQEGRERKVDLYSGCNNHHRVVYLLAMANHILGELQYRFQYSIVLCIYIVATMTATRSEGKGGEARRARSATVAHPHWRNTPKYIHVDKKKGIWRKRKMRNFKKGEG